MEHNFTFAGPAFGGNSGENGSAALNPYGYVALGGFGYTSDGSEIPFGRVLKYTQAGAKKVVTPGLPTAATDIAGIALYNDAIAARRFAAPQSYISGMDIAFVRSGNVYINKAGTTIEGTVAISAVARDSKVWVVDDTGEIVFSAAETTTVTGAHDASSWLKIEALMSDGTGTTTAVLLRVDAVRATIA